MISGSGSTLFEELGLYYIGPVDGHNVDDLVAGEGASGHSLLSYGHFLALQLLLLCCSASSQYTRPTPGHQHNMTVAMGRCTHI
jgi:hypothetical protein